jgi:NAD(P)-dependent dehydrogenase (short-subunit alcohol dehydrogenase family)
MNKSKNILITGVSTGIGYDLCKSFIHAGYSVYGSVRKQEDADRLISELGEQFHPLIFDVTDHASIDKAAEKLTEEIGQEGLGGLFNNAGIALSGPALHIPIDEYRRQFEVNVFGVIKTTQAFAPLLGARDNHICLPGKIFQISSISGRAGLPFVSPYVASKFALEGLSECLRIELQLYGIDVVVIEPGPVQTPIWNKSGTPEDLVQYAQTTFAPMAAKFQSIFVQNAIKTGLKSNDLANDILKIFEKRRSKVRYVFVNQKLKNWIIPGLLPPRVVDKFIGKMIGLIK